MQPQLRLAEADPELNVSPETFLARLKQSITNLEQLVKDLACTPDDLRATLDDPRTANILQLQAQIAALQVKVLAIEYAPQAVMTLVRLANESQKPEVARRSAASIAQLAGIAIQTKAAKPERLPEPNLPPKDSPYDQGIFRQNREDISTAKRFRKHGFDLSTIRKDDQPAIAQILDLVCKVDPETRQTLEHIKDPQALSKLFAGATPSDNSSVTRTKPANPAPAPAPSPCNSPKTK